jgi:hypothetical protein
MQAHASGAASARLSADTSRDIEDRQVEAWRRLSSVEVAAVLNGAWAAGSQLAWFSVKDRYPTASDDELRVRVASVMLGPELAARLYPESGAWLGR